MKLTIKIALLLVAALTLLYSCKNGKKVDDGSFAKVAEFETIEQANDFIKANRIKNVKTLDAVNGDRFYLVIPSKPTIRLDLANAVLDDYYNICEGELLTQGVTGSPIIFSYTAPEVMPLIVVVAVDEVGHRICWAPQYSGEDGSLITTEEFKLFSEKEDIEEEDGTPSSKRQYVKDAAWGKIPDVVLPEIDTTLINSDFAKDVNAEVKGLFEGIFTEQYNKYLETKDLGGRGPRASYKTYLCDTILTIVIDAAEAGFGPDASTYLVFNINTATGERVYNWRLIEIAGLTEQDVVNAFKIINSKRAGFKDGKVAYKDFSTGTLYTSYVLDNAMYLDDNSLIVYAEVNDLPYEGGTFVYPIPVQEVLEKIDVRELQNDPAGCYAVSDQYGSMFLVKAGNSEYNESFRYAIYESKVYNIEYHGENAGDEANNKHRDAYYNFYNMPGHLFKNNDEPLLTNPGPYDAVWSPVFLCNEAFMKENQLVSFKETGEAGGFIDDSLIATFEEQYGRKLVRAAASFTFGDNDECTLYSIQFDNQGNDALGVYAIATPDGISYLDFPATLEDPYSVWRVDDGGDFNLRNTPAAIFKTADGYTFMMVDRGPEGYYCYNITVKGGNVQKGDAFYSGYQAPM